MTFGIVGAETLLGRELRDQLNAAGLGKTIQLIGAQDEITGILSEEEGEPVVLTPLDAERIKESDVIFLAGTPDSSRKALMLSKGQTKLVLIDLTHTLETRPKARLHSVAHPAASALALIFSKLGKFERAVVQIFEPASERGLAGLTELQQQSSGLLTFQTLNKKIFDAQIAFNLLPRYGEDAPDHLQDVELRIAAQLTTLLSDRSPSIRLIQAPVFHGYSFSIWVEYQQPVTPKAISKSLESEGLEIRDTDLEPPTNAGSTGQSGITIGLIEADRNNPNALWMWAVADNFRLRADAAIAIARELGA